MRRVEVRQVLRPWRREDLSRGLADFDAVSRKPSHIGPDACLSIPAGERRQSSLSFPVGGEPPEFRNLAPISRNWENMGKAEAAVQLETGHAS